MSLDALALARWQFGITTVYHFFFVPLTIGLALLLAVMQTLHYRTRNPAYERMLSFFGRLFLINFALGVATGIVQEFQFGMNWSDYSRFVGDVFGAPLAIEGLLAFFMESTFLGLWMFGRDRLPGAVHLTSIWLVSIGTVLSALFILAANSWMQHPVGYRIDPATHRAVMTDFVAVLTNPTLLATFPHTILASILTGAIFVIGVAGWQLRRGRDLDVFRRAMGIGLIFGIVSGLGVVISGDSLARVMTTYQPMKMAAAEALYHTENGAPFSLFAIGTPDGSRLLLDVTVPHGLSLLATASWNGSVQGLDDLQAQEQQLYGPGNYLPVVPVTYWTFRLMVGVGFLLAAFSIWGAVLLWRGGLRDRGLFTAAAPWAIALPFAGSTLGWIFTEMGRQPWVVYGVLKTSAGVSPSVGLAMVALTLSVFTLLYGVLAVIDLVLMLRIARSPLDSGGDGAETNGPVFEY